MEVILVYDEYDDEKLQHVEEIIVSIFAKKIGIACECIFIHSYCVVRDGVGIAILKRNNNNDIFLLGLFNGLNNIVTNSKLALISSEKDLFGIALPTRLGIKSKNLCSNFLSVEQLEMIKNTNGYKSEDSRNNNFKFNLTFDDIKKIFNVNVLSTTKIDYIIDPHYLPAIDNIIIQKMNKNEIIQALFFNKENDIYGSVKYMNNLDIGNRSNELKSESISNKVIFLKVFYNERNLNVFFTELNKFISM